MGTNYYLQEKPPCECCGRPYKSKHIGKSSAGWCFALHVYPDEGINDLPDWAGLWDDKSVYNEYGDEVSEAEMLRIITERKHKSEWSEKPKPHSYASWEQFHRHNHSQEGPNGLVRSKIDGNHCIGHGDGTWDLIVGEFS